MPQVGNEKFPYTSAGQRAAQKASEVTGQPVKSQSGGYNNNSVFDALNQMDRYGSIANPRGNSMKKGPIRSVPTPQTLPSPGQSAATSPWTMDYWASQQPGQGQILPYAPQANDWLMESYGDYMHNWMNKHNMEYGDWISNINQKPMPPVPTPNPGVQGGNDLMPPPRQDWKNNESLYGGGPGSGGSRRMGTPTLGNVLSGRPNRKMY